MSRTNTAAQTQKRERQIPLFRARAAPKKGQRDFIKNHRTRLVDNRDTPLTEDTP
jgi:hypothetical protein